MNHTIGSSIVWRGDFGATIDGHTICILEDTQAVWGVICVQRHCSSRRQASGVDRECGVDMVEENRLERRNIVRVCDIVDNVGSKARDASADRGKESRVDGRGVEGGGKVGCKETPSGEMKGQKGERVMVVEMGEVWQKKQQCFSTSTSKSHTHNNAPESIKVDSNVRPVVGGRKGGPSGKRDMWLRLGVRG